MIAMVSPKCIRRDFLRVEFMFNNIVKKRELGEPFLNKMLYSVGTKVSPFWAVEFLWIKRQFPGLDPVY